MEDNIHDTFHALIARYLEGVASDADKQEIEKWIMASPGNLDYYRQVKNIRESSYQDIRYSPDELERKLADILNPGEKKQRDARIWYRFWQAAAILLLPMVAGGFYWGRHLGMQDTGTPVHSVYNEVFVARGTRSALSLSDGSRVWLNSGSSLKYPEKFSRGRRDVFLSGEAYFEIGTDVSRPFLVHTRNVIVKATGTKFNVLATSDEPKAEITLVSGKISVCRPGKKGDGEFLVQLSPAEHMKYDTLTGKYDLTRGDTYRYIAWKDGKLIFRNEPMAEVMNKISRFYNVEIELRGDRLRDYRYRATFEEESFGEILKLLRFSSPVEYREVKRLPLPDGSFPKRKVIIYPRNGELP